MLIKTNSGEKGLKFQLIKCYTHIMEVMKYLGQDLWYIVDHIKATNTCQVFLKEDIESNPHFQRYE